MPITLFLIQNLEYPVWKQRLQAVSDLEGSHFNAGIAAMAKYAQYLFNLQHSTARTVLQQRMRLTAYDEHNTSISRELEQLIHENALLHSGTLPPSDQDREWKVTYHRISEAEHGWNYAHQ
jgi:cell division protein FtsB